ncbi:MAG TPA: DnaA/Hda family protein [Gemmatimonadales bacterium]|nr:DnaA/Hda family protein [Gemmatimonadales bacterium]
MTTQLSPQFRFDGFVVGAANRLAATAARAVAESPGTAYNPLFIYARPGLGKTHLLMAIGHAAQAINPALTIEYVTLDDFVEAFHTAVGAGQGEVYRRRFAESDLLLLDDVQFVTHRRETQAELLRLVDQMQTAGRQIVLTSDRPPAEIEALDERLLRRVAGGLVIDIAAPDYETRVAILRRKAEERQAKFLPGVLEAVATLALDSVRELVGALNRLVAFQSVGEAPLDAAQARLVLGVRAIAADVPAVGQADGDPDEPVGAGRPTPPAGAAPAEAADEFGAFLSEVADTLTRQVEGWRRRVEEAIARWEDQGYRTTRLSGLLDRGLDGDPAEALASFVADIERLQALQADAATLAEDLAADPVFRDPDAIPAAEAFLARAREGASPPPPPEPIWVFDDLVESPGNRMALRSTREVAERPGVAYNPLVILGGAGVGKTHLLHALGNLLQAVPGAVVACLNTQDFTEELIEAIERDRVGQWRARYRRVTAFLLDDVQLAAGRERTQEELFLLFNHLMEQGAQLAFTSPVAPGTIEHFEERLASRLAGGLEVQLPPPEREVRQAVIERLLGARYDKVDAELASFLAGRPAESVRAVQALVQRVESAADARHAEPDVALAREVLEGAAPKAMRPAPGVRTSGVGAGGFRSPEKVVWEWPDLGERLIEEWR